MPAPAIPRSAAASRVRTQTFDYDWQGNTIATTDDAGAFFERSLGVIVNGTTDSGPNQMISAGAGKLVAKRDASGNLVDLIVARDMCADAEGKCTHRFVYDWDEVPACRALAAQTNMCFELGDPLGSVAP